MEEILDITDMEETICQMVIELTGKDTNKYGIEHRTDSYTSLIYCDNDFFRVKFTNKSQWISISIDDNTVDVNDPRFAAQKNKRQRHWKAIINEPNDIYKFEKELKQACHHFVKEEYIPRDINHGTITIGYDFEKNEFLK